MSGPLPQLDRLAQVMHRLRAECPWDAAQTPQSLVHHLVEETLEVVEAIEAGSDEALLEELGDLLLQIYFQAEIAAEADRFTLDDVAGRIADKLVARHPYVFGDAAVPEDLMASWEQAKAAEKGRTSVLEGIPYRLSALSRGYKVLSRAEDLGLDLAELTGVSAGEDDELSSAELGPAFLALVTRARQLHVDPEQAARMAVRELEDRIRSVES
ncbi:MAG: MazG family protein [Propionicimonas sp.]